MRAVYDTVAREYDALTDNDTHTQQVADMALGLTGPGPGLCIDIGCGTGAVSQVISDAGWTTIGIDLSLTELDIALRNKRVSGAVAGDALTLPIQRGVADLTLSTYTHTDVPDWDATVLRAAQTLRSGALFVYVGMHPAFVGPHAQRIADRTVLHTGYYRDPTLRFDGPGLTPGGWRERVGVRHRSLAEFLNAFPRAGLVVNQVTEGADGGPSAGGGDMPWLIGIRAVRL